MVFLPGVEGGEGNGSCGGMHRRAMQQEMGGVPVFSVRTMSHNQRGLPIEKKGAQLPGEFAFRNRRSIGPKLSTHGIDLTEKGHAFDAQRAGSSAELGFSTTSEILPGAVPDRPAFAAGQAEDFHRELARDRFADESGSEKFIVGMGGNHEQRAGTTENIFHRNRPW